MRAVVCQAYGPPGIVFAGEVALAGKGVGRFRARERVYSMTGIRSGAYAEYLCIKETALVARSPSTLSDDQVAAIPYGSLRAWCFLKGAGVRAGQRVLVYGASGAIGSLALRIAKPRRIGTSSSGRRRVM